MMRAIPLAVACLAAGCGTLERRVVATDVQTVQKPVTTKCTIQWPPAPTPHLANVQLTGREEVDAVLVWRAMEAEMEERIAYEKKLEAAASACAEGKR